MSAEAVAPVIISTSSPVMTAWRVRLNRIWYLLIISPAFLEAFCGNICQKNGEGYREETAKLTSMALRRAEISQAWPSDRAQKRELAREYSRRLESSSSSTSKAAKLARQDGELRGSKADSEYTHATQQWPPR